MGLFDSKSTTTNKIPAWLESGSKQAVQMGENIANRTYTPYTGERVAGLAGNERSASNLARYGADESRQLYGEAEGQLGSMEDYSGSALAKYQNPYTEAVLQPQLRDLNTQYGTARTQLLNSKAGAFGGDRAALEESQLEKGHRQAIADTTGKTYSDAFLQGQQAFFQDQNRKIASAQALEQVGGQIDQLNRGQVQDLMATGGTDRLLQQANLDFDYGQFIENRDWDVTNLQPLLASLQVPHTTTTESKQSGGAFGQILGAAATVAGAYFSGGTSLAIPGAGKIASSVTQGTGIADSMGGSSLSSAFANA